MRIQPRLKKGSRVVSYASLLPAIRKAVDHEANHFKVSRSFVIATALADALGIDTPDGQKYYDAERKKRRKNGS